MGKVSKWLRGLLHLGLKKQDSSSHSHEYPSSYSSTADQKNKKWSFVKSYREKDHHNLQTKLPIQRSVTGFTVSKEKNNNNGEEEDDDDDINNNVQYDDTTKHAMAVAEATKVVAEAAVAAAEAAAAVVRLTSSGRQVNSTSTMTATSPFGSRNCSAAGSYGDREIRAAVKVQSHFRAYLSRRALRALKALVRLQALFRGHVVRKDNANRLRRMQTMVRTQVRTRTAPGFVQNFESPLKSNQFNYSGPATPEKFEHLLRARSMKHGGNRILRSNSSGGNYCKTRMGSNWMDSEMDIMRPWEEEEEEEEVTSAKVTANNSRTDAKGDKILELDSGKPLQNVRRRRNLFHSCHSFTTSKESTAHHHTTTPGLSSSSCELQSFISPMKFDNGVVVKEEEEEEESSYYPADDYYTASSKLFGNGNGTINRGPYTPTKSDCSRSCQSGYSDYCYPSYMAYTESAKAKMRSLSAPKQRPSQYEIRSSPTKRYSIHGYGDSRTSTVPKISSLHTNFTNKIYPGSGRLDRLGMPIAEELISFSGGLWHHRS